MDFRRWDIQCIKIIKSCVILVHTFSVRTESSNRLASWVRYFPLMSTALLRDTATPGVDSKEDLGVAWGEWLAMALKTAETVFTTVSSTDLFVALVGVIPVIIGTLGGSASHWWSFEPIISIEDLCNHHLCVIIPSRSSIYSFLLSTLWGRQRTITAWSFTFLRDRSFTLFCYSFTPEGYICLATLFIHGVHSIKVILLYQPPFLVDWQPSKYPIEKWWVDGTSSWNSSISLTFSSIRELNLPLNLCRSLTTQSFFLAGFTIFTKTSAIMTVCIVSVFTYVHVHAWQYVYTSNVWASFRT